MYRSTRSRALLRGGGAAKRGIAAPKSRSLFVRSVGGRRVAYRFYFYEFEGAAYFRQLVTTKGGQVVTRADIASADFAISTVHVPDEAHSLPICTPQFLSDCVLEDTVKDPAEYLAEYPAAQSSQPGTQTSPMAYDDDEDDDEDGDEDDIIQDVRRLYDDGALDAEDRVVNSLLASQSRSISEYAAPEPGSPGASSTNSMDVSDSDYRTRRILNRTSRSFTDAPAVSSPLALRRSPRSSASPAPVHGQQPSSRRATLMPQKSPSFIAARSVFEPRHPAGDTRPMAANAAITSPARPPQKAASSAAAGGTPARAKARQSHGDRMAAGDPAPEKVGASSPELEMPFSQIPMGPNFTFIQSQVDGGAAPASARARRTRASKSTTGGYDNGVDNHSDNAGDSDDDDGNSNGNGNGRRLIELVHDLSDEEYPDPTAFLDPRDSGLNINYPVQDTSSSPDAGGPVTQDPEALVDADRELSDDERPQTPTAVPAQASAETPSGAGRKRRRGSTSESGYGEQPVPVVIKPHAALTSSLSLSAAQRAQPSQAASQPSQEEPGSRLVATLRSQSLESVASPGRRGLASRTQNWSASKRIRMSGSSTPTGDDGSGADGNGPPPPSASIAMPNTAPVADTQMSPQAPAGAPNQAASLQTHAASAVVLADESSGYPAASSSAPQLPSQDAATHVTHVSQTPDESSPVLISSGTASSQVTEPVPGEGPGSSDDDGDGNVNDTPDAPNVGIGKADEAGEDEDGDDGSGGTPAMDDGACGSPQQPPVDDPAGTWSGAGGDPDSNVFVVFAGDDDGDGDAVDEAYTTPQRRSSSPRSHRLAATGTKTRREAARAIEKRRQTLNVLGRPRGASTSRHISTCQRLLELYNLTKSDGGLGIQLDPALAPPARLVSGELHSRAYTATAASSPSTPTRRATFSGAMRVLGEGEPSVTDLDRLRYMCKVKGLMAGTELSVREALRTLYFFTGDWVSARRYILLGEESLGDDCMWSAEEDGVLLQGLDLDRMAALRQRKGSVEVYRRLQFLNTFHGPRAH